MKQGLLFIPDITGFSKFVHETEISHSKHIVRELLDAVVHSNQLGLKLAEVEGDALFFYKEQVDSYLEVLAQAKKMYLAFHAHIEKYSSQRICNCGACSGAVNLELKFIVHSGPIELVEYQGSKPKPYGRESVVAHRLLKSGIELGEYILLSDDFLRISEHPCKNVGVGVLNDKDLGEIPFKYIDISKWKDEVTSYQATATSHDVGSAFLEGEIEVDQRIDLLFQMLVDFRYRALWNDADELVFDEYEINRAGSQHYCVVNGNNIKFETISVDLKDNTYVFGEKLLEGGGPFKDIQSFYILNETPSGKTRVKLEIHAKATNLIQKIVLPLAKIKLRKNLQYGLSKIKEAGESFQTEKVA